MSELAVAVPRVVVLVARGFRFTEHSTTQRARGSMRSTTAISITRAQDGGQSSLFKRSLV